jgi:hypothetical protein
MISATKQTEFRLGRLADLEITATFSALIGTLILWGLLSSIAFLILKLPAGTAIIGGFATAILHQIADLWHQLGHAWAARRTGYPMSGIRFGFMGVLSSALYPADEPALPPHIHIRRALGGPLGSLVMSVIAAIIFLVINTSRSGGTLWWLALFFFLDNFVVFTLEIFLPLGFNDASTLLYWLRQRQAK